MTSPDELPVLAFADRAALEAWYEAEHATAPGMWLRVAKLGSGIPSVTIGEALDVALCFGWIDGKRVRGDERTYLQRYTPRRSRSRWSQVNVAKVAELEAAGRMRPAGLAEVERAKADGRWAAAYAPASAIEVPDDLRAALDASPAAAEAFAGLDARNRYSILYRVGDAKRPETRARRIATFIAMLERGERPYP